MFEWLRVNLGESGDLLGSELIAGVSRGKRGPVLPLQCFAVLWRRHGVVVVVVVGKGTRCRRAAGGKCCGGVALGWWWCCRCHTTNS